MDYFDIFIRGCNPQEQLNYFIEEFSKADKKGISVKSFYLGCLKVVYEFEDDIKKQFNSDRTEIISLIEDLNHGLINFSDDYKPELSYEKKCEISFQEFNQKLKEIDKNNYKIDIRKYLTIPKKLTYWSYYISMQEIIEAKTYLDKAKKIIELSESEKSLNQVDFDSQEAIKTKNKIDNYFEAMHTKGWNYAFQTEEDYNIFSGLLIAYFTFQSYNLPDAIIKLKKRTKTRIANVLREIHKDLSEKTLRTDKEYFEIIRILNHFKNEVDLYRTLTK